MDSDSFHGISAFMCSTFIVSNSFYGTSTLMYSTCIAMQYIDSQIHLDMLTSTIGPHITSYGVAMIRRFFKITSLVCRILCL